MKNTAAIRRPNYAAARRRSYRRANACAFPNAANGHYFLGKLLDAALAAVTTMGVVVIFVFIFTVF